MCSAIRIRATINVTSLAYSSQLGDQTSDEFATLARRVKDAIESEYLTVPGQQTVDVLQFRYRINCLYKNMYGHDKQYDMRHTPHPFVNVHGDTQKYFSHL